jgi:SSS family solute:Na+ symporter
MDTRLGIILIYLFGMLVIGIIFRKRSRESKVEFFLAGRSLSIIILFFTMAATNFSAFTIFGFSGAGYRIGYSFYPVMGFGTGFMALSFYIIGNKIYRLSRQRNYITPSDFIGDRYNSPLLKKLFSLVMIVFTLPYIAIQTIASGNSLNSLVGIPYLTGAILVTGFVIAYVALGGMHSIAWTDLVQGLMMVLFAFLALFLITNRGGGFSSVNREVFKSYPELYSRPGGGATMGYGIWFGYLVLWFFTDPMFPQLFQRFMAAKDEKALNTTIVLYPLITTFLFFLTVSIGVVGRKTFPSLPPESTDNIFPLLLGHYTGPILSTVLLTGGLAALMSTLDSQLLTLTSMVTNDFMDIKKKEVLKEKLTVIVLGVLGILIAVKPPATILDFINRTTFNGLSVLAPAVLGGLYWKRASKSGAFASILAGEGMVIAYYFGLIRTPGIFPVIPVLAVTGGIFVVVSLLIPCSNERTELVFQIKKNALPWIFVFSGLFILGNDFWNWGRKPVLLGGLPLWVWYFFGLGILLSITFKLFVESRESS